MLISRLIILTFISLIANSALPFYALAMDVEGSSSVESSISIEDQASISNEEIDIDSKKRPRDPSPSGSESSDSPSKKQPKYNNTQNQNSNPNVGIQIEEKREKKEKNNGIKGPSDLKSRVLFTPQKPKTVLTPSPFFEFETNTLQKKTNGDDKKTKAKKQPEEKNNEKTFVSLIKMERPSNQQKRILTPQSSEEGKNPIGKFIIDEVKKAKIQIVIGCEQLTDDDLVSVLIKEEKNRIPVHILVGDNPSGLMVEKKLNTSSQICTSTAIVSNKNTSPQGGEQEERNCIRAVDNKRMHNKFIIIDDKVFVGSPNATTNAYRNNVESLVLIQDFELANLYAQYFEYIIKTADTFQSKSDNIFHLTEGDKILYEMRESLHNYNLKKNGKIKVGHL